MRFWPFGRKKADAACAERPVPTYLKPFLDTEPYRDGQTQVTGTVRCKCGCTSFCACRNRDDDNRFHVICQQCSADILLFDMHQHGWDTVVCHEKVEDSGTGEITEHCRKCGADVFGVNVWIEHASAEEFVSCIEGELPDSEWVNAFTWFAAHLTCAKCGCKVRSWADIECA